MIDTFLLEALSTPNNQFHFAALRYVITNNVTPDISFQAAVALEELHTSFNRAVLAAGITESCVVKPTDTASVVRKKCKKAFRHGLKHYPMMMTYAVDGRESGGPEIDAVGHAVSEYVDYALSGYTGKYNQDSPPITKTLTSRFVDDESGLVRDDEEEKALQEKKKTSTERVRRYYKRHPKKVREYLRKTVKDRVARNRDRKKAVEKHGKSKMKNHDVHHPNGAQNGNWRLAKKDHGRDKTNENTTENIVPAFNKVNFIISCDGCGWEWPLKDAGHDTYNCHKCGVDNTNTYTSQPLLQTPEVENFIINSAEKLKLQNMPSFSQLRRSGTSFGAFRPDDNRIDITFKNRHLVDVLRTIAHEMVHAKQNEMGMIKNVMFDGKTGSSVENSANAVAGIMLRNYGKKNEQLYLSEAVLVEGGASGHMMHPYEDFGLTRRDLDGMIDAALVGDLGAGGPVTEKLDGQNLVFTVRNGKVVFGRNKGHVKNRGENALDADGISKMFAGRGNIEAAFSRAAEDLQAAIQKLPPAERKKIFANGSKFMDLEIIFPDTRNVIPYGKSVLVMHGSIEYDIDGEEIGRDRMEGKALADAVTAVGADRQRTFGIEGPRTITFSDTNIEKNKERAEQYKATIARAFDDFGLDEDATLRDYANAWWGKELDIIAEREGLTFTDKEKEGLVRRWVDGDKKAFGVKNFDSPAKKEWFRQFEAQDLKAAQKRMIRPVESSILRTGAASLMRVTDFISANNPEAAQQLRQEVLDVIQDIQNSNDPNILEKFQLEMERLQDIGMDNIVPSEGIVFSYGGKIYKFTGSFAPVNQLLGMMRYGRVKPTPAEERPPEKPTEKPTPSEPTTTPEPTQEPKSGEEEGEFKPEIPAGWEGMGWEDIPGASTRADADSSTPQKEPEALPAPEKPESPGEKPVEDSPEEKPTEEPPATGTPPTVAIFAGRFHPFHAGHYSTYQNLVDRFGKDNVYIASSGDTDPIDSPFEFNEKQEIITKMFGVPADRVVQVKNPYSPREITSKLPEDTIYVTALGEKDADRLANNRYFKSYEDTPEQDRAGYMQHGYYTVVPQVQLSLNGRIISGTQLRRILGDPQFTDRAKQEVFTKAYGKFDQDMFDKIVKVTSRAEEARRITSMYAPGEEPDDEDSLPPEQRKEPLPSVIASLLPRDITHQQKLAVQSVLRQKVKNPETKRDILVASALTSKYNETEVQNAAKKMVQQAIQSARPVPAAENVIIEYKTKKKPSDKLTLYLYVRDYKKKELRNEAGEYFDNPQTFNLFPKLAENRRELEHMIQDAPEIVLSEQELLTLFNSEVSEILQSKTPTDGLKKIQKEYGRDVLSIVHAVKHERELAMPIVIKFPGGYYLMGGNTRLSVLAALRHTMPVKVLEYEHEVNILKPANPPKRESDKELRKKRTKEFKNVLDMTLINPNTGNEIKVDTAMDYNKHHPAHKVAMKMIRQKMQGLSNRAGVPKNRKK
jgi:hypothetical protein